MISHLAFKRVLEDVRCTRCGMQENLIHVLRDCHLVEGLWVGKVGGGIEQK